MPHFIQHHIDPVSILVVFKHITFTSVFSSTHVSLSIDFTCALAQVCSQTEELLDRPPGRPCGPRTSDHAITPSNGSRHTRWPIHNGGGGGVIYKVALRDKYSRESSHMHSQLVQDN